MAVAREYELRLRLQFRTGTKEICHFLREREGGATCSGVIRGRDPQEGPPFSCFAPCILTRHDSNFACRQYLRRVERGAAVVASRTSRPVADCHQVPEAGMRSTDACSRAVLPVLKLEPCAIVGKAATICGFQRRTR